MVGAAAVVEGVYSAAVAGVEQQQRRRQRLGTCPALVMNQNYRTGFRDAIWAATGPPCCCCCSVTTIHWRGSTTSNQLPVACETFLHENVSGAAVVAGVVVVVAVAAVGGGAFVAGGGAFLVGVVDRAGNHKEEVAACRVGTENSALVEADIQNDDGTVGVVDSWEKRVAADDRPGNGQIAEGESAVAAGLPSVGVAVAAEEEAVVPQLAP